MKQEKFTVPMLQFWIKRALNQEKRALSLGAWDEAEWCRAAAREWAKRLAIAQQIGFWEYEHEALSVR